MKYVLRKFFVKKFFWYLLTLIVALVLNFFLPRLIPGNPVQSIVGQVTQGMTDTDRMRDIYISYMKEFGLDKPLLEQFFIYIGKLLQGDLGKSIRNLNRPVADIMASAIPYTVGLQLPAILVGWTLGNLLGALAAYKRGAFDKISFPVSLFLSSIPMFIFSLMLLYLFAVNLQWFPINGAYGQGMIPSMTWRFFASLIEHWALPWLSLVLVMIGGQAIGMRSMSLYELNADYVLYAKLMGIRNKRITGYVFRNAVLPQVTGLALSLGTMITGALITEMVFNYPGIGTWMFTAIRTVDYPLISGCTLMVTLTVLAANFIIEIIYGFLDPRIKAAQAED